MTYIYKSKAVIETVNKKNEISLIQIYQNKMKCLNVILFIVSNTIIISHYSHKKHEFS